MLVGQGNCFFTVNKEENEKKEEKEKKGEVEEEITTPMQSSPAMEQSCTCRPRQFFFSCE